HGLKPVEVPLDVSWDLDVAMTKKAIAMMQPSVVFVASPNNPTGNAMSRERLEEIVKAAAGGDGETGSGTGTGTGTGEKARAAMVAVLLSTKGSEGGGGGGGVL